MKTPLVSVILPVRNAESTVDEAVASILAQTLHDFELIAVDDRSSDRSGDRLRRAAERDPRVRIVPGAGAGTTAALNTGLHEARGRYVARQDADDRSMPSRLEKQVDGLDRCPTLCALGTAAMTIDDAGETIGRFPTAHGVGAVRTGLRRGLITPCHGSMMIRHDAIAAVGGYRSAFAASQDFDLWLRLIERWDIDNLQEPLYHWRLSSESVYGAHRRTQVLYGGIGLAFAAERARYGSDSYPELEHAHGDLEAFASEYRLRALLRSIWGDLLFRAVEDPRLANRHLTLALRHGHLGPRTLALWAWTSMRLPWVGGKPLRPKEGAAPVHDVK
jgi:glycosyltransferase involved in cell wall biosynthesis